MSGGIETVLALAESVAKMHRPDPAVAALAHEHGLCARCNGAGEVQGASGIERTCIVCLVPPRDTCPLRPGEAIEAPAPDPVHGTFLFHQWAANQLPPRVRDAWKHRFVLAVNHRLGADTFLVASPLVDRLDKTPEPDVELACPECRCKVPGAMADCLIARFHHTFESIEAESIAAWYLTLDKSDVRDVRAFLRAEAKSDPMLREALARILTAEVSQREGVTVKVSIRGRQARPRANLRDAFMLTAMAAANEWTGIPIQDGTLNDCVSRVAYKFGEKPETVRNRWKRFRPEVSESIDLHDSPLQ